MQATYLRNKRDGRYTLGAQQPETVVYGRGNIKNYYTHQVVKRLYVQKVIWEFSILDIISGDDVTINCKPSGNPRCNPASWNRYGGYSDGCCSNEEKCTINEGDCNLDSECVGSLVCMPNTCPVSDDISRQFHTRASCCQQPSGAYILRTKYKTHET